MDKLSILNMVASVGLLGFWGLIPAETAAPRQPDTPKQEVAVDDALCVSAGDLELSQLEDLLGPNSFVTITQEGEKSGYWEYECRDAFQPFSANTTGDDSLAYRNPPALWFNDDGTLRFSGSWAEAQDEQSVQIRNIIQDFRHTPVWSKVTHRLCQCPGVLGKFYYDREGNAFVRGQDVLWQTTLLGEPVEVWRHEDPPYPPHSLYIYSH